MEFEYVIENGEVTITGIKDKFIKSIEIPEFIDGLPVTTIGHKAFYDCSSLSMIIIPTTINKIFYTSFDNLYGVTINSTKITGYHIINNKFIASAYNFLTILNQIGDDYVIKTDLNWFYLMGTQLYMDNFEKSIKMKIC